MAADGMTTDTGFRPPTIRTTAEKSTRPARKALKISISLTVRTFIASTVHPKHVAMPARIISRNTAVP